MQMPDQMIPETQPEWITQWPLKREYARKFPDGIKMHYLRTAKPRIGAVQFHNNGISINLDNRFRAEWRYENSNWIKSCSCGYPKDTCVHTWYVSIFVEYAIRLRSWQIKAIGSNRVDKVLPAQSKRSAAVQPRLPGLMESPSQVEKRLDIEADFKLNPGQVTLRFYEVVNGRRAILRMQTLFNLAQTVSMKKNVSYRKRDISFLLWAKVLIEKMHVWKDNLQVLKLYPSKFDEWVDAWKHEPDRFLDRETQKPLALKVAATLQFELIPEGEKTRIKCFLGTSSENRQEFHKVFPHIREKNKGLLNGVMVNLALDVSWQTLVDCFSKKSPGMPTELVCEHLPILLENRLDLLTGGNIRHLNQNMDLELRVRDEGSNLQFEAVKDGRVVSLDGFFSSEMSLDSGVFKITSGHSEVLTALRNISSQMDPGGEKATSFPQSEKIMERLLDVWPAIAVPKISSDTLSAFLNTQRPTVQLNLRENRNWLDYSLHWTVDGGSLSHDEVKQIAASGSKLYRSSSGDWLNIDLDGVRTSLSHLKEVDLLESRGSRLNLDSREFLSNLSEDIELAPSCQKLAEKIRSLPEPSKPQIPEKLTQILRPYQKEGVEFMYHRLSYNLGVVLADDMGLGKTLQTLALISCLKRNKPVLVIAPASVVYVWQDEVKKFMPDLKVDVIVGAKSKRDKLIKNSGSYDLLISSYHLVRNSLDLFKKVDFSMVVLDEAQVIKNPAAKVSKAVKSLRSDYRLALSGTPVENRLSDLWSLFDFINPGFLGTLDQFNQNYETGGAPRHELAARIRPLILRRTKEKVAPELPPRTEELVRCAFDEEQSQLYKEVLKRSRAEVKQTGFSIFAALTRLRQICCDPRLMKETVMDYSLSHSAKLKCLLEMVEPIIAEGHSILVFSQFTSMLEIIEAELNKRSINQFKLTGSTPTTKRPALINEFNECADPSVFLLSLKAAGTGLTLTKADYVFLYDPWWNPAAEQQAIDRTHRIGQDKPVFVYKLIALNSVEDKILKLQDDKRQMVAEVLEDDTVPNHFSSEELAGLLEDF